MSIDNKRQYRDCSIYKKQPNPDSSYVNYTWSRMTKKTRLVWSREKNENHIT